MIDDQNLSRALLLFEPQSQRILNDGGQFRIERTGGKGKVVRRCLSPLDVDVEDSGERRFIQHGPAANERREKSGEHRLHRRPVEVFRTHPCQDRTLPARPHPRCRERPAQGSDR